MTMKKALLGAVTAMTVAFSAAPAAHAGGFLADTFVRPFSPHLASELDKQHAQARRPLDHAANVAAGVAADAVVPGTGPAVTGVLQLVKRETASPRLIAAGSPPAAVVYLSASYTHGANK